MVKPKSVPKQDQNEIDDGLKEKLNLSLSVSERTRSAANALSRELHTSTNSRSSDHERGEHTPTRFWSGRRLGQSRTNLRGSKAMR